MTPKELNVKLLKTFPILKTKFDEYTSWQEGLETGSHLVYEDIFVPYIIENEKNSNKEIIEIIFIFIESLFDLNDLYAENVIAVSVLEPLKYNYSQFNFEVYMCPKTKKLFSEIKC